MKQDVFVSYSTKDKTITDAIVASLEKNQIRCWYAPRDIKPSEDWAKAISNAIEQSRIFLLIFSGNSNQSQRVLDELNFAISQQIPILPFRVENLEPDGAMRLHLSSRHWLDAYDPSWENHIQKLVHAVSSNLEATIAEEDVEVPETINRTQKTLKNKSRRLLVGIVSAALVIAAGWYGLTQLNKSDNETTELNFSVTEQALTSPSETEESQETTAAPTEDFPPATQTLTATMSEQGPVSPEAIRDPCQILFLSDRSGYLNLWLMEPDGGNQTQLSFNQYGDFSAAWSPDGTQIAFDSLRDGDNEIFIMNADGTNIRQLTSNDFDDTDPVWSPDGERIAYYSNRDGEFLEVYTMELDGSNVQQITHRGYRSSGSEGHPPAGFSWSPDGSQIAFVSNQDGDFEIVVMDADGSNQYQLTSNDDFQDIAPDWSPDGERIIFVSNRFGDYEIFVMNTDGSNLSQLTSNVEVSFNPAWSPDGTQIVFSSNRDGDFEIWSMDADGSNQQQLTLNDVGEFHPAWSPLCK
jgi:Tol biopolymer transport system component